MEARVFVVTRVRGQEQGYELLAWVPHMGPWSVLHALFHSLWAEPRVVGLQATHPQAHSLQSPTVDLA